MVAGSPKSAGSSVGSVFGRQIHIPGVRRAANLTATSRCLTRSREAILDTRSPGSGPSRLLKNSSSKGTFEGSPKGEM